MHKVVFEVAIDGAEKWEAALRNMANVQKSLDAKTTKIEVVAPKIKKSIQRTKRKALRLEPCQSAGDRDPRTP